jgi:hypothetical protein
MDVVSLLFERFDGWNEEHRFVVRMSSHKQDILERLIVVALLD